MLFEKMRILLLGLGWFCWTLVNGFNLDTRIPIIKISSGIFDSYFGFSVAQHRTDSGVSILLVGAPLDDNLQPGTNRSGALWQCPLTTSLQDCVQVETDGRRWSDLNSQSTYGVYDGSIDSLRKPVNSEIKDGQWLGVQVQSQGEGGNVIVCAHRYIVRDVDSQRSVKDSKRGMLGMCYILNSDLTLPRNDLVGYKNLMVIRDAMSGKRLEPRGGIDDPARWGVCQVGTSAAFVGDDDYGDEAMAVFGAPGCFTWRGNIFGSYVGSQRRYKVALNHESFTKYPKHGILGMAVTSGRYFDESLYLVSGAPHVPDAGAVYFFKKNTKDNFIANASLTLQGQVFGAGFGYSLASLDVNGDAQTDLLVGAPFSDYGTVYMYLTENGKLKRTLKIVGETRMSQFGLSISSIKDLNHDGYEDFACGAPYEGDSGGAVYIFLGGPNGLLLPQDGDKLKARLVANQILLGTQMEDKIPGKVLTFGSSLSGGMDLDGNGYPDLLIGAYQSEQVFLIRSRPVIDIHTSVDEENLRDINPGDSGCKQDPHASEVCFVFQTCFQVLDSAHSSLPDEELMLKFVIQAEPNKPMSRVAMRLLHHVDSRNRSSTVTDTIKIRGDAKQCTDIIGYVGSVHGDFQAPVQFSMSHSLILKEPVYKSSGPLPVINNYPILNQAQANKKFQATFDKDCGSDDVCQAQIFVKGKLRDKHQSELSTNVNNGFYTLQLDGSELILDVMLRNLGEAAYETTLEVHFPHKAVSYIGLSEYSKLNAPVINNASWLTFNVGNPFKNNVNATRTQLRFSPHQIINEKLIQFYLNVSTSSVLTVDASTFVNLVIVKRAEVKIVGGGFPNLVAYGGENKVPKGESVITEVSQIGPQIIHKYLVINGGPSTVDVLTVHIDWPYQVASEWPQGKWLMYLSETPVLKNGRGLCVLPSDAHVNPLNYTSGQAPSVQSISFKDRNRRGSRRKRENVIAPMVIDDDKKAVIMDCDRGTAKCVTITCQIYDLSEGESSTIEIRSRLWNSTLVEDYNYLSDLSTKFSVEIYSKAELVVDDDISQNISDDYTYIRTIAERRGIESVEHKLRWWIILIAVLVGLLLLVLISLILWKLGFFKRKRHIKEGDDDDDDSDHLISGNLEKSGQ